MSVPKQVSDLPQESSALPDANQDKVSYDTYRKVLNEAKKTKELLKQYETDKQTSDETKLKEQNEWKTLAEQYQVKLKSTSEQLEQQKSSINNSLKRQAFEKVLGGQLRSDAYSAFIPFDKIILDTETNSINDDSVKMAVSDFVKDHSALVEFQTGKLPNLAPKKYEEIPFDVNNMTKAQLNDLMKEALKKL